MTQSPGGVVRVAVTAMTHHGAVRERNQDALVVGPLTAADIDLPDPLTITLGLGSPVVVAIADGLGGHAAGEVAAAIAVRRLARGGGTLSGPEAVVRLLREINDELYEVAAAEPAHAGTGTTIAGLVLTADGACWFNVGDARLYREEGGYLAQVSMDDSPRPPDTEPGAAAAPTNVVLQTLGGAANPTPIDPHVGVQPLNGGRWLLCSDGLSDLVELAAMEQILSSSVDDTRAVKELWAAAMNTSGRDNISIALLRLQFTD